MIPRCFKTTAWSLQAHSASLAPLENVSELKCWSLITDVTRASPTSISDDVRKRGFLTVCLLPLSSWTGMLND